MFPVSIELAIWSNGFLNKIKHCRRVATRYDKLAVNYLAFVQLASISYGCALMSPRPS